jgi:ABC-type oligopeptide transport system ATPase subunit
MGEILGIVGESSSGKSTLFKSICKLVPIQMGQFFIEEADVTRFSHRKCIPYRKKVQMIPHDFAIH